ncbi:acyltransferase [Micromonospora sp. BRA006-A]|nr:acyltransferase [Micromonospora sp. BRA006-A]
MGRDRQLLPGQAWIPLGGYFYSVNNVSWSLSCELAFYLCLPLVVPWLRRARTGVLRTVLVAAPLLILALWPGQQLVPEEQRWWFTQIFPVTRSLEFWMGVAAAELMRRHRWRGPNLAAATGIFVTTWVVAALWIPAEFWAALLAVAYLLVIAAAADADVRPATPWRSRAMVWLGEVSFAFYLVHVLVMVTVLRLTGHWGTGLPGWRGPLAVLGFLVVTLALAAALHRWVETPMMRLLGPSRRARAASRAPAVPAPRTPAEAATVPAADGGAASVTGPAEDIEYAGRRRRTDTRTRRPVEPRHAVRRCVRGGSAVICTRASDRAHLPRVVGGALDRPDARQSRRGRRLFVRRRHAAVRRCRPRPGGRRPGVPRHRRLGHRAAGSRSRGRAAGPSRRGAGARAPGDRPGRAAAGPRPDGPPHRPARRPRPPADPPTGRARSPHPLARRTRPAALHRPAPASSCGPSRQVLPVRCRPCRRPLCTTSSPPCPRPPPSGPSSCCSRWASPRSSPGPNATPPRRSPRTGRHRRRPPRRPDPVRRGGRGGGRRCRPGPSPPGAVAGRAGRGGPGLDRVRRGGRRRPPPRRCRRAARPAHTAHPRRVRGPGALAAPRRHDGALAGDLTARQLADVLARRNGWDPRRHPAEQEIVLARIIRDGRRAGWESAAARERSAWRDAELAAESARTLAAEAYAATAALRPAPAYRSATASAQPVPATVRNARWRPARVG